MKRVIGIGGVFFKSKDPKKIKEWYGKHLGIEDVGGYGSTFEWRKATDPNKKGFTAWSVFKEDTTYLQPSQKDFMFNYRVENLVELLKVLKEEGVEVVGEIEEFEYGKFGWIMDPDGNKIELWESNDDEYDKICEKTIESE